MKLFEGYEAVKFCEEDMIFITKNEYLHYIYEAKYDRWRKHDNAGNDHITVDRYPDVSIKELIDAMHGVFPEKETDFMRLCHPSQLWISNMLELLREDYGNYMSDYSVYDTVEKFLSKSNKSHRSFEEVKKLLDNAKELRHDNQQVINDILELSFEVIGRDVFKNRIGIVDGYDGSSYFGIMPVKVIDYSDTDYSENVAEMRSLEISIEEDDVYKYIAHFLYKHFDDELEANKNRHGVDGFEWYSTHNFFTFGSVKSILKDIKDTVGALEYGRETEFTAELKERTRVGVHGFGDEEKELIIDFYHRFIYRMEYMMKVAEENGYDLISIMGP